MEYFRNKVTSLLENNSMDVEELVSSSGIKNREQVLEVLGWMVDQDYLVYNGKGQLELAGKK
jgi:hypothetical protein